MYTKLRYQNLNCSRTGRSDSGTTLVEMTIVISVMAIISTAIFSILISTLASYRKLDNETSTVQVVRNAIERIGKDVRMARSLGDIFGATDQTVFPDATNNPIVGNSYVWPTWSDGTTPSSFTLGGDTLVIQIPIFDNNGFPLQVPGYAGSSNVETHIYRVLHRATDPSDEYVLEYACVPGTTVAGSYNATTATRKPTVVATGIIGPLVSGNAVPRVFQYIDVDQNVVDSTFATPNNLSDFTTIAINLEVRKHEATAKFGSQYKDAGVWAVKQEVYMRNNAHATPTNTSG